MKELRYTLVSDGVSDKMLLPILTWLLRNHEVNCAIQAAWADFRWLRKPPTNLAEKIRISLELYPCDLLFIHRDAEKENPDVRKKEIEKALQELKRRKCSLPSAICVIPVRMQEAWFLFDECALRRAAGNPNGKETLALPSLAKVEEIPDPKAVLYDLLRKASGLKGRRLQQMNVISLVYRIADFIEDFTPLYRLPAFQKLKAEIADAIMDQRWNKEN